jgi:tRNA pseudouridine38-40 synthase
MRYLARLQYNGSEFCGWQIQPNSLTVQEVIEQKLSMLLNHDIKVIGCGRTDTGVHAKDFYLHFDTQKIQIESGKLKYKLNSVLPSSIAFSELREVSSKFHARFSAISREYKYYIKLNKNPFEDKSWWVRQPLDLNSMEIASKLLLNYKDFTSFSKLHTDVKTNLCEIIKMNITNDENNIIITICANRFLRNMVRAIVGTLVEIGLGKLDPIEMKRIIESKDRRNAGSSAPAKGLFLNKIKYPSELIEDI